MGTSYSKKVPLSKISAKMLTSRKCNDKENVKTQVQLLSPNFCSSLIKTSKLHKSCDPAELDFLKKFLARQSNFRAVVDKSEFKKLDKIRKSSEVELSRALKKVFTGHANDVKLSKTAHSHLNVLINSTKTDLKFRFRNKTLISRTILPQLELLSTTANSSRTLFGFAVKVPLFFRSIFQHKLLAKDLRRNPRALTSSAGLERAHKLSLFLAVRLWKQVYGHSFVNARTHKLLRNALSSECNVYHTCVFTNRTLHVKYDNEIALALMTSSKISSGAKLRVRQILQTLIHLRTHSEILRDFCDRSSVLLKPMSWTKKT